ncbi:hypothetical protein DC094_20830 [Pelagibaculum spongiae]|uniref:Uncharacterized protein n=1 Tax=Pelagibaculum spongiae TaxID=2080658 RepID=A0A2V1GNJ1_9GAMM|nr:hypothetical protein DC094_20830 [Pelagibaculum spongiae]
MDNPLSAPVYMVKLNIDNAVYAGKQDISLTLDKYPGFQLDIAKGSATFPNGEKEGFISVTPVNASAVPMAPPNGMQPQFIVTIQPTGTRFDPPAKLTLPNVDGHQPGAQVEMYSYDHDLEEFVAIGLGSVSEDGATVQSNPGVGVIKAGWHCGSQPGGSGCAANCSICKKCDGECNCNNDDADPRVKSADQEGDCKTKVCSGGSPKNVADTADKPKDIVGDCKKPGCDGMNPTSLPDENDIKPEDAKCKMCGDDGLVADKEKDKLSCSNKEGQECYTCKDGDCGNHCDESSKKIKHEFFIDIFNYANDLTEGFNQSNPFVNIYPLSGKANAFRETGEECCSDCRIAGKGKYEEYGGNITFDMKGVAVVPGLGYALSVRPRIIAGYQVSGIVEYGLYIEGAIKGDGGLSGKVSECGESCARLKANLSGTINIGVKAELAAKFDSCLGGVVANRCLSPSTVFGASAKADASLNPQVFLKLDQGIRGECPEGKNCNEGGKDEGGFNFSADVAFEFGGFYKFTYGVSRKVKLWDAIKFGGCS